MIQATGPDDREYRWVSLTDPNSSRGVVDWSPNGPEADAQSGYTDYKLNGVQMDLWLPKAGINQYQGATLLADIKEAEIAKWYLDVDTAMFEGNYNDSDKKVLLDAGGLQAQGTLVQDLNGTDSNLATKGYIWAGINKMIDAIPFAMREEGPPMILFASENIIKKASAPDRIYQDKVEWDFIYDKLIGEKAMEGRKIGSVVVTNKTLISGTDTTGTHDRMILLVPDKRWLGRVVSRGFSLLDEEKKMFGIHQAWGWRGAMIVDNANASQRSEQIVWS